MFNPRRWLLLIAGVLALAFGAPLLFGQTREKPLNPKVASLVPERPTNYLTDLAGVVTNTEQVNARLAYIHDSLKLSMVAVVLPTIGDLQPDQVALDIGRRWMVATANDTIGAAVRNTGGVILIVMDTRKCRVEVATGSEGYMTDSRAADLCRDARDEFRANRMGDGIIEIAANFALAHTASLAVEQTVRPTAQPTSSGDNSSIVWAFFLILLVVATGGVIVWVRNERIRQEREREREEALKRIQEEQAILTKKRREETKRREEEDRKIREQQRLDEERRWNALTPQQQQAELMLKRQRELEEAERRAVEAEKQRKRDAEEAARRRIRDEEERVARQRRQREQDEEDDRRRRDSYITPVIFDSPSYSSDSSSSSSSSDIGGGSDSFSGGGGGSDW